MQASTGATSAVCALYDQVDFFKYAVVETGTHGASLWNQSGNCRNSAGG